MCHAFSTHSREGSQAISSHGLAVPLSPLPSLGLGLPLQSVHCPKRGGGPEEERERVTSLFVPVNRLFLFFAFVFFGVSGMKRLKENGEKGSLFPSF